MNDQLVTLYEEMKRQIARDEASRKQLIYFTREAKLQQGGESRYNLLYLETRRMNGSRRHLIPAGFLQENISVIFFTSTLWSCKEGIQGLDPCLYSALIARIIR